MKKPIKEETCKLKRYGSNYRAMYKIQESDDGVKNMLMIVLPRDTSMCDSYQF